MKVSVAMATYNGEKYIKSQLQSILTQTIKPDEVIISDDGSTDNTLTIIKDFIEKNKLSGWRLLENNSSQGISGNFINALKNTSGDIVFLCDQDDIWINNKVENMTSAFDKDTECVISAIKYIDDKGIEIKEKTAFTNSESHIISQAELCRVCSYLGMAAAFRKDVILKVSIDFIKDSSHDWALMETSIREGIVKFIGEPLQLYRIHYNNASIINEKSANHKRLMMLQRQEKHIDSSIKYLPSEDHLKYKNFIRQRFTWIKNKKVLSIFISFPKYKEYGYSLRTFVADLVASTNK